MSLTISLAQTDIALGDPEANFECVRAWTAEAARRGSALVVFPELWSTGYDLENWQRHASPPAAQSSVCRPPLPHQTRVLPSQRPR